MAFFNKEKIQEFSQMNSGDEAILKSALNDILNGTYEFGDGIVLLFEGNGASGYNSRMPAPLVRLKGQGRYEFMAAYKTNNIDHLAIREVFTHKEGIFAGFTVRKFSNKKWRWATVKDYWSEPTESMERRIFKDGDTLDDFEVEQGDALIFEAVWENKAGEPLEYGYKFFRNRLLARSMGGYWGKTRLNTKLALHNSIQNKFKFVEVDMRLTADKEVVCSWGWSKSACETTGMIYKSDFKKMTREMFLKETIDGMALMDGEILYRHMLDNPELLLSINIGVGDAADKKTLIKKIVSSFNNDQAVLDRCVITVDCEEAYQNILSYYPFKYFQYVIKERYDRINKAITFCVTNGICALVMDEFIAEPEIVRMVRSSGLYICAQTVDGLNAARRLLRSGVSTVVTNFLSPARLDEPEKGVKVAYNSTPDCEEHFSELMELGLVSPSTKLKKISSGAWEFVELGAVSSHAPYKLTSLRYSKEGYVFTGWAVRAYKSDGTTIWLCTDDKWHLRKNIENTARFDFKIIPDRGTITENQFPRSNRIFLVAQWMTEEEYEEHKKQKELVDDAAVDMEELESDD